MTPPRFLDLWEVAIGKRLARAENAAEMAAIVRTLVERHGAAIVGNLDLYIEDEAGETVQTYSGAAVASWADGLPAATEVPTPVVVAR